MSNLKRITDAHAELKAGKLAMHVCIPYSLAAELASMADDLVNLQPPTWSASDSEAACEEGWDVFHIEEERRYEIQRCDWLDMFKSDAEAVEHVYGSATTLGKSLHRRALLYTLQTREVK